MKRLLVLGLLILGSGATARAEGGVESTSSAGRYQIFTSPHVNRMYILDTQTGRVFQLANYKDVGKEILEEVPYVYGSTRLCTPAEYERSPDKCFSRNYEYMKNLIDIRRQQVAPSDTSTAPPATSKPEKK